MDSLQLGLYSGKLTFSTPSTQKKTCKVLGGEKNIRQMHTSRKNSWQMNGLKKKLMPTTIHITLPSPAPPRTLTSKVVGP